MAEADRVKFADLDSDDDDDDVEPDSECLLSHSRRRGVVAALPYRFRFSEWHLWFSTAHHGWNTATFLSNCATVGPNLLIIRGTDGTTVGAFAPCGYSPPMSGMAYFGNGETFLWCFHHKSTSPATRRWTTRNAYFMRVSLTNDTIVFGGGARTPGLSISSDLRTVTTASCETYGEDPLGGVCVDVARLECWGLDNMKPRPRRTASQITLSAPPPPSPNPARSSRRGSVTCPALPPTPAMPDEAQLGSIVKAEVPLLVAAVASIVLPLLPECNSDVWCAVISAVSAVSLLLVSFRIVHHADCLAVRWGEPYATFIINMSETAIEFPLLVSILADGRDPTIATDAVLGALMLTLNAALGVVIILSSIARAKGQCSSKETTTAGMHAQILLTVVLPLTALNLVIPIFTERSIMVHYTLRLAGSLCMYVIYMAIQRQQIPLTIPPQAKLPSPYDEEPHSGSMRSLAIEMRRLDRQTLQLSRKLSEIGFEAEAAVSVAPPRTPAFYGSGRLVLHPARVHAAILTLAAAPLGVLSWQLGKVLPDGLHVTGIPIEYGGFLVASVVLAPEIRGSLIAASAGRIHHSLSVLLGGAVSFVSLTIPLVMIAGRIINRGGSIHLETSYPSTALLAVTMVSAMFTFHGRGLQYPHHGVGHFLLFLIYISLTADHSINVDGSGSGVD